MRTTILLLSLALLLCQPKQLLAQTESDWQTFVDVSRINGQFQLNDEQQLIATDGGIQVVDIASGQIIDRWTKASHGLPSNMIEAIVRDPLTQKLIIGTYDLGMFRAVSGVNTSWEAIVFPDAAENPERRLYCMAYDDQNRLLIGTDDGMWVYDQAGNWDHYGPGQTNNFLHEVWEMLTLPDGTVYAAGNVLMKVSQGEVVPHAPVDLNTSNFDSLTIAYADRKVFLTPEGDLWDLTDINLLSRYKANGEWELYSEALGTLDFNFGLFKNNFVDAEGVLYLQSYNGDYHQFIDGSFEDIQLPFQVGELNEIGLVDDQLMGRSNDSLFAITAPDDANTQLMGKMGNWPFMNQSISYVFNDDQSNSWAKLGDKLLNLTNGEEITLPASPVPNSSISFLGFASEDQQDLWLGTSTTIMRWENQENLVTYPVTFEPDPNADPGSELIRGQAISGAGQPWYYNYNKEVIGLINGEWTRITTFNEGESIIAFLPFSDNRILVETYRPSAPSTFYVFSSDGYEEFTFPSEITVIPAWTPLAGNEAGTIWFNDHNEHQLIKFTASNNEVEYLNFPVSWVAGTTLVSFRETEAGLLITSPNGFSIYKDEQWTTYNRASAPFDSAPLNTAILDRQGVVRVLHNGFRRVMESANTGLIVSSVKESNDNVQLRLEAFPNPATTQVGFVSPNAGVPYQVYSSLGQLLRSGMTTQGNTTIQLNGLAPGNYVLRSAKRAVRLIVK